MAVIALASVRGAPGVTTTALATTLVWPRPVVLVEADVSGSSSIKAGHLRGAHGPELSLINLALAHRNGTLGLDALRAQTLALTDDHTRLLVPALATRAQAVNLTDDFWAAFGQVLRALGRLGVDVIVDAGRLGMRHGPEALLNDADLLAVVCRTSLDDLVAVRAVTDHLLGDTSTVLEARGVVVVGDGRPHHVRDVGKATTLAVWGSVAWDPLTADKLNGRERFRTGFVRLGTSPLIRSSRTLVDRLKDLEERRQLLLTAPASSSPPDAPSPGASSPGALSPGASSPSSPAYDSPTPGSTDQPDGS